MKNYKTDNTTTVLRYRKEPMEKRTVDLLIKIVIEIVDWISVILKEKRKSKPEEPTKI